MHENFLYKKFNTITYMESIIAQKGFQYTFALSFLYFQVLAPELKSSELALDVVSRLARKHLTFAHPN